MMSIKPPVFIKERPGGRLVIREVRNVESAARCHLSWPQGGRAWRKAAEVLLAALEGEGEPETVRKAFVAAAREAGVYVDRD